MRVFQPNQRLCQLLLALIVVMFLPFSGLAASQNRFSPRAKSHQASSASTAVNGDRYFEFHSGFWINLHLFLYEEAITRNAARDIGREVELTSDSTISATLEGTEKSNWDAAVAYYQANYVALNLQTNDRMRTIKNTLEDIENASSVSRARLDPALVRVLNNAASVYRTHWWPAHDKANRDWIAAVTTLADRDGDALTKGISTAYEVSWPDVPLRVDVAAYANSSGAFTTLLPTRITISSQDPGNQKMTALEALFHEASHTMVEDVGNLILQDFAARKKKAPPQLLHAILYFTTGYFVKQLHPEYITYADGAGLWHQTQWPSFEAALVKDWEPHLEGKSTAATAVSQLVADIVATSQ